MTAAPHVGGDHDQGEGEAETHIGRRLTGADYQGVENHECEQELPHDASGEQPCDRQCCERQ